MFKRLFWLVVGFALGIGSSLAVVRRLRRVAERYAPPEVAQRWGGKATSLGRDVRAAVKEGRDEMRRRELELGARLPGARSVESGDGRGPVAGA